MKRHYLFLGLTLLLTACADQEDIKGSAELIPLKADKSIRSFDEALQIAQSSITLLGESAKTRSQTSREINLNATKVYKLDKAARTRSDINDTLMYVFNFEDNQGFAIISASKDTEGLLALTEKGNYDPNTLSSVEGFNQFIDMAKNYIQRKAPYRSPAHQIRDSVVILESSHVSPMLTVKWGQDNPEGEFCPNGIAGCMNTACAQVLSYYEHPNSISLTYDGADISNQSLNWTQIKSHQTGHSLSSCQTPDTHQAIGRLVRQLGEMNGSNYSSPTGTGTLNPNSPKNTMINLGYQATVWYPYSFSNAKNALYNQQLLFVKSGSHIWVFDGYIYQERKIYHLSKLGVNSDEWFIVSIDTEYTQLCHYNWGWYGDCDGYFSANVFDTQAAEIYESTNNHDYDFTPSSSLGHAEMMTVYR